MARCFQKGIHSLADSFLKYSPVSLRLEKMFPKCVSFKVRMDCYHHLATSASFIAQTIEFYQVTPTS